jgi:hypothetical protein
MILKTKELKKEKPKLYELFQLKIWNINLLLYIINVLLSNLTRTLKILTIQITWL